MTLVPGTKEAAFCGSLLADLDVHPRVAMAILRHAQFAITRGVDTRVSDEATLAD